MNRPLADPDLAAPRPRDGVRLALVFEAPHNGWLPVRLRAGGAEVEFVASAIPNNPVQDLIDAIGRAAHGRAADVWWHLEPDGYYFAFRPEGTRLRLEVTFAPLSQGERRRVLTVTAPPAALLLPLWRALRGVESFNWSEPHWPRTDFRALGPIGAALRVRSAIALPAVAH